MDSAFIIGNGESRLIFSLKELQGHGRIYGCNAIYRDHPDLCDVIVSVSLEMSQEIHQAKRQKLLSHNTEIVDHKKISRWNYVLPDDDETTMPNGADSYRYWVGSKNKKNEQTKLLRRDFSKNKGSGCSAVLHAAEAGYRDIIIIGFDLLGARQWEFQDKELSREQNNVYKNTPNYPNRHSMKAYHKYEWLYQLTQIFRKFPKTNFYFINRLEYIIYNNMLTTYFSFAPNNIRAGSYANLKKYIERITLIRWMTFKKNRLIRI